MWWEEYIGIPFEDKGRTNRGCDCYGLLRLIYAKHLSVDLPSMTSFYEDTEQREEINGLLVTRPLILGFRQVSLREVAPFDVLVIRQAGFDCHLGVVVKPNFMIHSESGKGAVLENFIRPHVRPRVKEAWRYVR